MMSTLLGFEGMFRHLSRGDFHCRVVDVLLELNSFPVLDSIALIIDIQPHQVEVPHALEQLDRQMVIVDVGV
jgi:hypothetical protein